MANVTNFSNIAIDTNGVAGDNKIDVSEGNTSGFKITGSGSYAGNTAPSVNQEISVTVLWSDGTNTFPQTINAIVTTVTGGKTFTWEISESNFSTTFPTLKLGSNDTVRVTFPSKIQDGTLSGTASSPITTFEYACFLRGTRVLTRHGYCPVEELAVGDEVRTLSGGWQSLRWVGHQRITTPFGLAKGAPVRITAGAFGPALPARDVFVSQEHAIFFRNHLIPAKSLINGVTVFCDTTVEDIEYFHLLLDRHDVIFSEGLATESYVPCENIDWFDNTSECPEALLNAIRAGTAECLNECYPRQVNGPAVEAARALLARFAPADVKDCAVG
ncbi:Hint domain-containing protein [Nitrosomonas sp. Nm33]|uniref:Hint domain-containing protein n=1 Tax=Nitrosomonas sp. Nm33 TaxID=133724 RepID=UPI0008981702|nr:Hint domain-containing protein [Nitrosomonas sp. Nm33]SDZ16004.1 Hint domain-containing protein [Nitrosomonas sp. Nm33]